MTIDEAIERLKTDIYKYADFKENPNENEFWMAFDMAIKALEQQSEDAISRAEAVRVASGYCHPSNVVKELKRLPSVQPIRPKGHWILTDDDFVYCSECEDSYYPRPIDASWYYCPHCGAKMIEMN